MTVPRFLRLYCLIKEDFMAIASLVLGILALVLGFVPGVPFWISLILAIIGIILGATARKKDTQRAGIATAGMVLSIISVVIAIIVTVACAAMIGIGLSALS